MLTLEPLPSMLTLLAECKPVTVRLDQFSTAPPETFTAPPSKTKMGLLKSSLEPAPVIESV